MRDRGNRDGDREAVVDDCALRSEFGVIEVGEDSGVPLHVEADADAHAEDVLLPDDRTREELGGVGRVDIGGVGHGGGTGVIT